MNNELFLEILAMEEYNSGYNESIILDIADIAATQIGNDTVGNNS